MQCFMSMISTPVLTHCPPQSQYWGLIKAKIKMIVHYTRLLPNHLCHFQTEQNRTETRKFSVFKNIY